MTRPATTGPATRLPATTTSPAPPSTTLPLTTTSGLKTFHLFNFLFILVVLRVCFLSCIFHYFVAVDDVILV